MRHAQRSQLSTSSRGLRMVRSSRSSIVRSSSTIWWKYTGIWRTANSSEGSSSPFEKRRPSKPFALSAVASISANPSRLASQKEALIVMLLRFLLGKYIRRGALSITTAKGAKFTFGDGFGEPVAVRILTSSAERQLLMDPELALGEIFMDGSLILERGTIADLLAIAL